MALGGEEREDDDEQRRCEKEREASDGVQEKRAERRAEDEKGDDEQVVPRLAESVRVRSAKSVEKRVRSAAQVARAHRRGEGEPADAAEGLDLQGADEGDDGVDGEVADAAGQEDDERQQGDLDQQDALVPGDEAARLEARVDGVRDEDAASVGGDGEEIPETAGPVERRRVESEEDHVSRDGVGEDVPAAEVGVDVRKAADEAERAGGGQSLFGLNGCLGCHGRVL